MKSVIMGDKEFMSLGRGSMINVVNDKEELQCIIDKIKKYESKTLARDLMNVVNIMDSTNVYVCERDYFDETLLIRYKNKMTHEEKKLWIPIDVVMSGNQELPKLSSITNDKLFQEWLSLAEERMK